MFICCSKKTCNDIVLTNQDYRSKNGLPLIKEDLKLKKQNYKDWKILYISEKQSNDFLYKINYVCSSNIEYHTFVLNKQDSLKLGFSHDEEELLKEVKFYTNNQKINITIEELRKRLESNFFKKNKIDYNLDLK